MGFVELQAASSGRIVDSVKAKTAHKRNADGAEQVLCERSIIDHNIENIQAYDGDQYDNKYRTQNMLFHLYLSLITLQLQ